MLKEKIKNALVKQEKLEGKKKIENLVVFIVLLIITIVAINFIWKDDNNTTSQEQENTTSSSYKQFAQTTNKNSEETSQGTDLEERLEKILSNIEGVGEVNVLITYSQSSEVVAMYNETSKTSTTKESDAEGGERNIEESDVTKEVIYQEENGESVPVTQTVIQPKIEGVLITAVGANNAIVKSNIIQAIEAVTGVATHKIQVFEMSK